MMLLIKRFPELNHKTIWQFMTPFESGIVFKKMMLEMEFGRALPDTSFYKSMAIRFIQQAGKKFRSENR